MKIVRVPADPWESGYDHLSLRADVGARWMGALTHVHDLGGILTTSGGMRALSAPVTAGRATYSLHCLGLAVDLYVHGMGMTTWPAPYWCEPVDVANPAGRVNVWLCPCAGSGPSDTMEGSRLVWAAGKLTVLKGQWPCITGESGEPMNLKELLDARGLFPIGPRKGWPGKYGCSEAWHMEARDLIPAGATYLDMAMLIGATKKAVLATRPKAGQARWDGARFVEAT